jgi:hypothetical protein
MVIYPLDLLTISIIPFDTLILALGQSYKKVKALKIIRLLRLLKLAKVFRSIEMYER